MTYCMRDIMNASTQQSCLLLMNQQQLCLRVVGILVKSDSITRLLLLSDVLPWL